MEKLTSNLIGYKTSRDYKRLVELMKKQSIICIVDFSSVNGKTSRNIAQTLFVQYEKHNDYTIGIRGLSYVWAVEEQAFIAACARFNIEFIEPNVN